jgi:hypothetical protein
MFLNPSVGIVHDDWSEPVVAFAPLSHERNLPQRPVSPTHGKSGGHCGLEEELVVCISSPFRKGICGANIAF